MRVAQQPHGQALKSYEQTTRRSAKQVDAERKANDAFWAEYVAAHMKATLAYKDALTRGLLRTAGTKPAEIAKRHEDMLGPWRALMVLR